MNPAKGMRKPLPRRRHSHRIVPGSSREMVIYEKYRQFRENSHFRFGALALYQHLVGRSFWKRAGGLEDERKACFEDRACIGET